MTQIAMCSCGEPLVMTIRHSGKEFECVVCGALYTYFGPTGADETPELLARMEQRKAEFKALTDGLLPSSAYMKDCDRCPAEYHIQHASMEELKANEAALERLAARRLWVRGVKAGSRWHLMRRENDRDTMRAVCGREVWGKRRLMPVPADREPWPDGGCFSCMDVLVGNFPPAREEVPA